MAPKPTEKATASCISYSLLFVLPLWKMLGKLECAAGQGQSLTAPMTIANTAVIGLEQPKATGASVEENFQDVLNSKLTSYSSLQLAEETCC